MGGFLAQHSDICPAGRHESLDALKTTEMKRPQLILEGKGDIPFAHLARVVFFAGCILRPVNDGGA
jgi:hypothetical protein